MAFIYDLLDTWNNAGTVFSGIKLNVTNTASAAGSKLIDLQIDGSTFFNVDKSGQVALLAGSAAAPTLIPTGDTNTGMWFPAADTIAASTGGTERLRIDSAGRILAGGTTPYGIASVTGIIQAQSTSVFNGGFLSTIWSANASPTFISLGKSRGAAIGTHTIVNSGDNIGSLQFGASDGTQFIDAARITASVDGTPGTNDMPGRLTFNTTADGASAVTERMRINSSGNVGIGTSSPTTLLSVNGVASFGAGTAALPSVAAFGDLDTGMWFPAANTLAWSTGGSERMRVYSSGGVSIGNTTDPGSTNLSVSGNIELGNATDTTLSRARAGTLAVEGKVVPYVFAQTGTAVSVSAVTTEEALATITIPGGAMGPNGWVEIYTSFSFTGSTNTKALRIRAGGIAGGVFFDITLSTATQVNYARLTQIINNNSQNSQKGFSVTGGAGTGIGTAALPTTSVNTASNWDLVITGQKGSAGETLTLESYKVIIYYGA